MTCSNRPLLKSFFFRQPPNEAEKKELVAPKTQYIWENFHSLLPHPPPENPSEGDPRGTAGKPIEKCLFVAASGAGAAVGDVVLLAKSRETGMQGARAAGTPSDDKSLLTDYSTVGTYCRHSLAPSGTTTRPTNQPASSNKSASVSSK